MIFNYISLKYKIKVVKLQALISQYEYSQLLIFMITYIHDYLYSDGLKDFGIPKTIWAAEKN